MTNNRKTLNSESVSKIRLLIGSKIKRFIHEQFVYTPISFRVVGVESDSTLCKITSSLQDCDLMDMKDELCFLDFNEACDSDFRKAEDSSIPFVDSFINQTLQDVILVHDTIDQYIDGKQISSLSYTKAIIFVFENKEYCFEQDWHYQEVIGIAQGHDLVTKLNPPESEWDAEDSWGEGCSVKCTRTIEHLK